MPDIFVNPSSKPQENPTPDKTSAGDSKVEVGEEKPFKRGHGRFSAFWMYPERVNFETKEANEKVILLLRKHPITNLGWILLAGVMLLAPSLLDRLNVFSTLPGSFQIIINLAWYLVTLAFIMESFLDWFFNVYIVTNLRVIDIDFVNLIYKNVSDANIDKIQDVSYNMGGVGRTIFNYGDVIIQTAAEIEEFDFEAIPNPAKVAKIIEDLMVKK